MGFQLQASTIRRTVNSRRFRDQAASARLTRRAQPALSKQCFPMIGSARSQPKFSGNSAKLIVLGLIGACATASSSRGEETGLRHYSVVGDAIPVSLTGSSGDPTRGRTIVVSRQSTCLLCHSGPFPEEKFHGNLGPDLAGTGSRWSEGQLRLRVRGCVRAEPGDDYAALLPRRGTHPGRSRLARQADPFGRAD